MKKYIVLLLSVVALLSSSSKSYATHLMGSEIQYTCIGNGQYEIYLKVYRDCNGISLSQSDLIVHSTDTTFAISNQTKLSIRDITDIGNACPFTSRCAGGSFPHGIEEHVWKMTMDLSSYSACEWTLSWEQNARNGNITTGQASQKFYTQVTLNKCFASCNSSPVFKSSPTGVALVCQARDLSYDYGALDTVDHDSISYHLVPALIGANTVASYIGQYTFEKPLTYFGFPSTSLALPAGFHFNNSTGLLQFRPMSLNQVAVIVVEAREWRMVNGSMQIIGTTRRDMQIAVISCPNNADPIINGPYARKVCAGNQICIPINTSELDANDTVQISWDKGLPGAIFTNNNGQVKLASGEVCWTPTVNDIDSVPKEFKIKAKDNSCIRAGETTRSFSIYVSHQDSMPEADLQYRSLGCGVYEISHTNQKTYTNYSFKYTLTDTAQQFNWNSSKLKDTVYLNPGNYSLQLEATANGYCTVYKSKNFTVADTLQVGTSYSIPFCETQSVLMNVPFRPGQSLIHSWFKSDSLGQLQFLGKSKFWTSSAADTGPYFTLDSFQNCLVLDTVNLIANPYPKAWIKPTPNQSCLQQAQISFSDSIQLNMGQIAKRYWLFGDGDTSTQLNPTHTYLSADSFEVFYFVESALGCADTATTWIWVLDNPVPGVLSDQFFSSSNNQVGFSVGAHNQYTKYQWQADTGSGFFDIQNNSMYSGTDSSSLLINGLSKADDSTSYRCVLNLINCGDTSISARVIWSIGAGIISTTSLNVLVYPNPALETLFIESPDINQTMDFTIMNSTGQSIYTGSLNAALQKINISHWPKGVYFIHFNTNESAKGYSFIKQ